ncbi:MAG: IPT/TIG domain-containing protein [Deltaproteobacteria bacterium]|nr:IPT/TIG domain-containing protein [Deltaproteobacteria bacterium]
MNLIAALLLTGCWLSDDEIQAHADGTDAWDGITLTGVVPESGLSTGGQQAVLWAEPTSDYASVRFGDRDAEVLEVAERQLTVRTPPGEEGWVTVSVSTATLGASLPEAYYYWEDGQGRTGLIGSVERFSPVGGGWDADLTPWGQAQLSFIHPAEAAPWEGIAPALDTCQPGSAAAWPGVSPYLTDISQVVLATAGGGEVALSPDPLTPGAWQASLDQVPEAGSRWSLQTSEASPWPAMLLPQLVQVPAEPRLNSPAIFTDATPALHRDEPLRWSNWDTGDFAVLRVARSVDGAEEEVLRCALVDDGAFELPLDAWEGWQADEEVIVYFGRARSSVAVLPHNRSEAGVSAFSWVVGAALTKD